MVTDNNKQTKSAVELLKKRIRDSGVRIDSRLKMLDSLLKTDNSEQETIEKHISDVLSEFEDSKRRLIEEARRRR